MKLVDLNRDDRTPVYVQLERGLRAAIATERLRVGAQLPTVRQLAVDLRVNANTIARVYLNLERAGVLETRRGVGTFVRASPNEAWPPGERSMRLRELATRVLSSIVATGFTIEDVNAEIESLIRESTASLVDAE